MARMNEKTKQILKIVMLMIASGFFLFQGFSLLFTEQESEKGATVKAQVIPDSAE